MKCSTLLSRCSDAPPPVPEAWSPVPSLCRFALLNASTTRARSMSSSKSFARLLFFFFFLHQYISSLIFSSLQTGGLPHIVDRYQCRLGSCYSNCQFLFPLSLHSISYHTTLISHRYPSISKYIPPLPSLTLLLFFQLSNH